MDILTLKPSIERSCNELDKREWSLSSDRGYDPEVDFTLSLPSYDIQQWTKLHISLCASKVGRDVDKLNRPLLYGGYDQALLETHGTAERPDHVIVPPSQSLSRCRLPLGRIVGKKTNILLGL